MTEDQKQRLEALNIGTYNEIFNERWEMHFEKLKKHYEEHGHCKYITCNVTHTNTSWILLLFWSFIVSFDS